MVDLDDGRMDEDFWTRLYQDQKLARMFIKNFISQDETFFENQLEIITRRLQSKYASEGPFEKGKMLAGLETLLQTGRFPKYTLSDVDDLHIQGYRLKQGYGRIIQSYLSQSGLSQRQLAQMVGVNIRTIARYVKYKNTSTPHPAHLLSMIHTLQIPLDELFEKKGT